MNKTGGTVIERVEFQATSPKRALPGIEYTISRMDALVASVKRAQAQIAGLSSNASFRLSAKQFQDRAFNQRGQPVLNVTQLARRLGFDPKDVRAAATLIETEIQSAVGKINRAIERNPAMGKRALAARQKQIRDLQSQSFFSDASSRQFRNTTQAGKFFERYAQLALKDKQQAERALAAILTGTTPSFAMPAGNVTPAQMSKAVQDAVAAASRTAKTTTAKVKSAGQQKAAGAAGNNVVESRITTPDDKNKPVRTVVKRNVGNGLTEETVHENEELVKTTVTDAVGKRAKAELKTQLLGLKEELKRNLPATAGRPLAMKKLMGDLQGETGKLMQKYGPLGLGGLIDTFNNQTVVDVLRGHARGQSRSSSGLDRQRNAEQTKAFITEYRKTQSASAALNKQRERETTRNYISEEKRRQSASLALDKQRQKAQAKNFQQELAEQSAARQTAAAQMTVRQLRTQGAQKIPGGRVDVLTGQVLSERYRLGAHQYDVTYGKGGANVTKIEKPAALGRKTRMQSAVEGMTAENMAANVLKVGQWAAAVGVLYKSFDLARYSLERLIKTGAETAHLGLVFRQVGGTVQQMTADTLALTAAQGRETSEMMESATEWARLGGDRQAINEQMRVSAMAANIANMHVGETTKQLSALTHIYHLQVSDLNGTLGMLTNTSLKWNVQLEDIFIGLDRAAAAAKVAKVPLAELQAMIGVVVGATGQTGSMTGNSIKYIFQELNKPDVQQQLRAGYGVETLTNKLGQKPAGQILQELHDVWGKLGGGDPARQQRAQGALSNLLGGRFNAARVPIIIENYPKILQLAVDGQLNLNKAQEANAAILNTLKVQLAGVRAEWDRIAVASGNSGMTALGGNTPMQAMTGSVRLFKNLMHTAPTGTFHTMAFPVLSAMGWLYGKTGIPGFIGRKVGALNDRLDPQSVLAGHMSDAFRQVETAKARSSANQYQVQMMDRAYNTIANGTMTGANAQVYADELNRINGSGGAFQNARKQGDMQAQQQLVVAARKKAQADSEAEEGRRKEALARAEGELTAREQKVQADIELKTRKNQGHEQEDRELADLRMRHLELSGAIHDNAAALEQLAGDTENVMIASQPFISQLQAQADALERISQLHGTIHASTQTGALNQQAAALKSQLDYLIQSRKAFDETHDTTVPEAGAVSKEMLERIKRVRAQYDAVAATNYDTGAANPLSAFNRSLAAHQDQLAMRGHAMETSQAYGVDEADKLANQRRYLQDITRSSHDQLEVQTAQNLLLDNAFAIQKRRIDVEREIKQLAIDQNKEFARSLFGAGPAEMLKKLSAFRLAMGGGLSQGQMFSLSPSLRQDYGLLSGNNYEMSRLRLERNKLNVLAQGLPGFARGGYTGSGPAGEVAGVVHKGEYVLSQQDLFNLTHDNLYPRGTRLLPVGGVYRPAGLALDNMDGLNRPRISLAAKLRMAPQESSGMDGVRSFFRGYADEHGWGEPGRWGQFVRGGRGLGPDMFGHWLKGGWNAMRNPRHWASLGRFAGKGLIGGAITGGLNYFGHRLGLRGDTAGGAVYGVGADAAGGAVFGPAGAATAATVGLGLRLFEGIHGLNREQIGGDRTTQQVARHQEALLRDRLNNPHMQPADAAALAHQQGIYDRQHAAFQSRLDRFDESSRALSQKVRDAILRPGVKAGAGSSLYRDRMEYNRTGRLPGYKDGGYTGDGPPDEVAGVVHRGEVVIPKKDVERGGDSKAVKACEAALNSLAGAAGRVQSAFDSLASRVDRLFAGGTGGMAFAAPGQSRGWYPGKTR